MNETEGFDGFSIPTKNFFLMPNCWTDITAKIDNLAELKIVEYVLRHTWGYQEYGITKTISVDEFMHGRRRKDRTRIDNGTGLSEPSVKDGIKRAIKHGYLICEVDDKDQGRVKKSYGLKMSIDCTEERGKNLTPQDSYPVRSLPPEGKDLTPRGKETYPRSEKDTIERHLEKESESENVVTANADANSTPVPSEKPQEVPAVQSGEKPKKPRAPRTPAEGQVTKAQFDAAFKVIDETLQDLHNNSDFHVLQSKAAKESVKALILSKGAPKTLALVIRDMWNEQNKDGTFWWREKGHMTVKAICEQYSSRAPHLAPKQPTANGSKPATSAVESMQTALVGVSGLPITRSNGQKLRILPPERKPRHGRKAV